MALRDPDPEPLLTSGVEVGLHLEPVAIAPLAEQLRRFERLFGRSAIHLDGHHHCHAHGARVTLAVARLGRRLGIRVRSVSSRHRRLLRWLGVRTNDQLVGRMDEGEPALPEVIRAAIAEGALPPGLTEWMVHPGHTDSTSGSSYDAGREQDLRLLIELAGDPRLQRLRVRTTRAPGG
jgi:chitin disaccharide deacetylase